MGTLVQSPDVVNKEISGLQPIMKPVQDNGLGTFLSSILPAVNEGLQTYEKETRDRNIALGQNDALNGIHREVSLLDRQNYNYGISYQQVVNGQALLTKKFILDVNATDTSKNPDPDALFKLSHEYMNASVDNIYQTNLPAELKEQLYQAQLKESAVHMKLVNTKMEQVRKDVAYNTRLNLTAGLARDLQTVAYSAEDLDVKIEAYQEGVRASIAKGDPSMSREDIDKEVNIQLTAALKNSMDNLRTTGQPEDSARLALLADLADRTMDNDLNASTMLRGIAEKYRAEIQDNNETFLQRQVQSTTSDWALHPELATEENANKLIDSLYQDSTISFSTQTQLAQQVRDRYTQSQEAILKAQKMQSVSLYDSPSAAERGGFSESEWITKSLEKFQKDMSPDQAGYALMVKGSQGAEYSKNMVTKGSEVYFRTLNGYLGMSDADVKADGYSKQRQESFAQVAAMYKQYKAENGTKALDLLSGVDEKYVDVYASVLENGGTLEDARLAMKNPIDMKTRYSNVSAGITGINAKNLGLRKELLGGTGGRFFKNMGDALESTYVDFVQTAYQESAHALVAGTSGKSTEGLLVRGRQQGMSMASPSGYSDVIVPVKAAKQMQQFKTSTGAPISSSYMGKAFDAKREAVAKSYGVRPDNVIVKVDSTGQDVSFYAYEIKGDAPILKNGNDSGVLSGGVVTMAELRANAEKLYGTANTAKRNPTYTDAMRKAGGTMIGKAVITTHGQTTGKSLNVNSLYANAFGGNIDLAMAYVNHLKVYEGFTDNPTKVNDQNTGRESTVYAMGVTAASLTPETKRMFDEAKGIPQRLMDLQGGVMQGYYKALNINKDLQKAGVPLPSSGLYPAQYKRSLMLIYDVGWHGHNGGLHGGKGRSGVIDAMNAPTLQEGLKLLRNSSVYDRKNAGRNRRNVWYEDSLRAHFQAKGK